MTSPPKTPPTLPPITGPVSSRGRQYGIAAAILSAACWGTATVMSKAVLDHMPPMTVLVVQLSASVLVLWLTILVLGLRVGLDRTTGRASLSGLLEPGLSYAFGMAGLALTTASSAALIGATEPLFILLLAWLFLGERIGPTVLGLAVITSLGLMVVVPDAAVGAGQGSLLGDALVVLGTLAAAIYVIATRRLVGILDPLPLSALQQSVGLAFAVTVAAVVVIIGGGPVGLAGIAPEILALAAISGIVQYALAFWLYLFALRHVAVNVAAFSLALIPVFGIGAAILFLGESLSLIQGIGAAMIVLAVAAISRLSGSGDFGRFVRLLSRRAGGRHDDGPHSRVGAAFAVQPRAQPRIQYWKGHFAFRDCGMRN